MPSQPFPLFVVQGKVDSLFPVLSARVTLTVHDRRSGGEGAMVTWGACSKSRGWGGGQAVFREGRRQLPEQTAIQ